MPDESLRRLERAAQLGDEQAHARYWHELARLNYDDADRTLWTTLTSLLDRANGDRKRLRVDMLEVMVVLTDAAEPRSNFCARDGRPRDPEPRDKTPMTVVLGIRDNEHLTIGISTMAAGRQRVSRGWKALDPWTRGYHARGSHMPSVERMAAWARDRQPDRVRLELAPAMRWAIAHAEEATCYSGKPFGPLRQGRVRVIKRRARKVLATLA